jgi:hypothetical protein
MKVNDMKPKGKSKPAAGRAVGIWKVDIWKAAAALPPRIWTIGGAVVLVVVIVWFLLVPARWKGPMPTPFEDRENGEALNRQPSVVVLPRARMPEKGLAFIKAVRLQPTRPTRMDMLKAEVEVASTAPKGLVYSYRWRVNDKTVEEAKGDTLNLSPFKKRDLIAVTVTPYNGDTAGFAVDGPVVAIHSVPPSLELKAMRRARKTGEPVELQLAGVASDGEQVTYSLEAPHVSGMTIDRQSGKISWLIQPDQKGTVRFGAAVEDDNGTKVTRIFDVTVD